MKAVKASLGNFITEGKLEPSQVRVLATRRTDVEIIESGLRENQGSDWSNILVETVHRFKGMEADAVVLVLREEDESELRRLAYVGMSRPVAILHVIGDEDIKPIINWD